MAGFVHLHNHTEYSLLDGANRIPDLVAKAVEMEMPALAISDHGVMFGVMDFHFACQAQGIRPILGMEAYVAPNGRHVKAGREENQTYHLLLLAKNLEGYRNLCKLHSIAALEGFYYRPRIDHEILRQHRAGLIGTSACLGSEICRELLDGNYEKAQYLAGMYKELFEEDSFFIELQDHRLPEQAQIREDLLRIAREVRLPLVATNDAHYLCRGDAAAHDALVCIGVGELVRNPKKAPRFSTDEFYLKSPDDMRELFREVPEAIENTLRIAEMCHVELGKQQAQMPLPELPEGTTSTQYLRQLAERGLRERFSNPGERELQRLDYELGVIEKTGFSDYFLLVREFAEFTRKSGITFGVRGSAAGSLVIYCLGITDIDPLEYDVTFERFLNPERIAMPDIDMDFEDRRREEVIHWVTERYGSDRVAQIITFGTLGAKQAIRDAGRVLGLTPQETDRLCKTFPGVPGMTLKMAWDKHEDFRTLVNSNPRYQEVVRAAHAVEGLARHSGVHAAGVVISREPLMEHVPLYRGTDGQTITAYDMGVLEKIGLLKMDFLGLSNLTVLAQAVANIKATRGVDVDLRKLPLDDTKTYELLGRGETTGVFQLESDGMRRNIMALKPQNIREVAAMVALYRPGPMKHIAEFIDSKHGRRKPVYLHPLAEPILRETYGVIVYQDQVFHLVQALAGFSLGKADVLRRAISKKDVKAMSEMKSEFLQGAQEKGVAPEVANDIWAKLLPFAGYAFNKAHAICYAIVAYQTAYLKANYPVEYLAALLLAYRNREDKVGTYIEECRKSGIAVLPPDINRSGVDFTIERDVLPSGGETNAIRFGLAAIKGLGEGLVRAILAERERASFSSLFDFCERARPLGLSKLSLEALAKAGALDAFEPNRATILQAAEQILAYSDQRVRAKAQGQDTLFESDVSDQVVDDPILPQAQPLSRSESLSMEREVLGIYISDHPLRGFETSLHLLASHTCAAIQEADDGTSVTIAGVITAIHTRTSKATSQRFAHLTVEDFSGAVNVMVPPKKLATFQHELTKDRVVLIRGKVTHWERANSGVRQVDVRLDDIESLTPSDASLENEAISRGALIIRIHRATKTQLMRVKELLQEHPGDYLAVVQVPSHGLRVNYEMHRGVSPEPSLVENLRRAVSECEVVVRVAESVE